MPTVWGKVVNVRRAKVKRRADLILAADWHLRDTVPTCRTDQFEATQWQKVVFIRELQAKHNCPVIHSGDMFHHWKASPYLLAQTILFLPQKFYTVYGNHDLPQHSMSLKDKSAINVLEVGRHLTVLSGAHFGEEHPERYIMDLKGRKVLVWHVMAYKDTPPYPGCTLPPASKIMRDSRFKDCDLIVTGDNHIPFVEEYRGRLLVNPGSLTRQTAAQVDHKPRVYLWFAKENEVEAVYIPIKKRAVSREHLKEKESRDKRVEAFVEWLRQEWEVGLSFEQNLKEFLDQNKVRKSVVRIIQKAVQEETHE